jgi:hypothetical protein
MTNEDILQAIKASDKHIQKYSLLVDLLVILVFSAFIVLQVPCGAVAVMMAWMAYSISSIALELL